MDRHAIPVAAGDPDCPARGAEIRRPDRSGGHELRGEREVRP